MSTEAYIGLITAFVVGSIPFGWIIAKLWGVEDLRKVGSANIGATNVVRTAGWAPGALTFLLDFAKGLAPVLYFQEPKIWIGLAAVIGHCYSPFLKFRGGKGVSTTFGAVLGYNPWVGGAGLLTYVLALALTRVSALGSLFAMLTLLTGAYVFLPSDAAKIAITIMVFIVLSRHRDNWNKLLMLALLLSALCASAFAATLDFRNKPIDEKLSPQKVVALMPSLAETVVSLGAASKLVGAPDYSRLPPNLGKITKLGPYNRVSAEAVYSLHPDLVFASMDGNDQAVVDQLERLHVRVVTVNTQSLSDIVRSFEIMAAALGDPKNALVNKVRATLTPHSLNSTPHKHSTTVFVQVGWEPLVTISKSTFIDELVVLAGGKNVFADSKIKYPRPSPEEVIAKNPDVMIICRLTDTGDEADRAREFWERFKSLSAVKTGKIYILPVDMLTKPGLPLVEGLHKLQKLL